MRPRALVSVVLLLLLLHWTHAGPPYAYFHTRHTGKSSNTGNGKIGNGWAVTRWGPGDYKPALFGVGWSEVTACRMVTAEPRFAGEPLSNSDEVRGKIALVHRDPEGVKKGRTSFVQKALHAQQAGAIMAIVVNYKNDMLRPADVARGHDGPVGLGTTVTIPVIAVPQRIGQQLAQTENGMLSLIYDIDDWPLPDETSEPVCVVQTPGEHIAAAQAHYQDGVSLESAKRPAEALEAFRSAIALHPRHADALNGLGSVLSNHKKQHRKAGVLFQAAMAVEPDEQLFARNKKITRTKMKEVSVALGEEWSAT